MKEKWNLWQFAGFAATSMGGTLLHFLYDWTKESIYTAPFSGVNESTWEHMKLLFFPLFVFALIERRSFWEVRNFWCIKLAGIGTGLLLIPVLFYTYNGAYGKSPNWVNLAIFFLSAASAFLLETKLFSKKSFYCKKPVIAFLVILALAILFILFTFFPPQIPLFQDPITKSYGI